MVPAHKISRRPSYGVPGGAFTWYVANKGEADARDAGRLRLEGKEYVVADGDVMHFRFNT